MYDRITERLKGLGYKFDEETDSGLLLSEMNSVRDFLMAACNLSFIPKVLEGAYIDIVCGYFLKDKLLAEGPDSEENLSVGRITEGDVTVEYDTDKQLGLKERTELLAERLIGKKEEIIANRKLRW